MEQLYGIANLSNDKIISQSYSNFKPSYSPTKLYEQLRLRLDKSKKYIAYDQIYSYTNSTEVIPLKEKLMQIPELILEVCFEFGVEIVCINRKQIFDKIISYRNKKIRIQPESFYDMNSVGFYEPGARLVGIFNKYVNIKDYNPLVFYMAKGFQHAILSNQNLLKIPEYHISYNNRFLPYFVIRYALRKHNLYFPYSVEEFASQNRWKNLKDEDRPMFRFLEMMLGKHHSTIK